MITRFRIESTANGKLRTATYMKCSSSHFNERRLVAAIPRDAGQRLRKESAGENYPNLYDIHTRCQ
jgi:hypothetical protein